MKKKVKPIVCRHCGKEIRLPPKPRDLGLLLHVLTYRVPIRKTITEDWIETARKHCRMKPERLAALRNKDYERLWSYMEQKRSRRLAFLEEYGEPPPYGWTPPATDEPDHSQALIGMRTYRKTIAKLKAKQKRNPEAQGEKLLNRYLATRKIRSKSRKMAALNDIEARLLIQWKIEQGELTVDDVKVIKTAMLPDDALPRRFKKKTKEDG